jgi:hypothetical protein
MQIEIPDDLYKTFIDFLDLSQASFTEEDLEQMTEIEKDMFVFIENLIGNNRIMRYKTKKELNEAKLAFIKNANPKT